MKAEELFYSLDHVGEDLIGAAEQNVLVRKHRPWGRAAVAALLIAAVGVGGFFLWRNLRGRNTPSAAGQPGDSAATSTPQLDPPLDPDSLPMLELGDCWTGLGRTRFDDLQASMAGSLVQEYDFYDGSLALPVYERDPAFRFNEAELAERLRRAADWIGAAVSGPLTPEYEPAADGSAVLSACSAETDQGRLTVYADGRILMLFDEAHAIIARVKPELSEALTPEQTVRVLRDARMEHCGEQLAERLGLGECRFVSCEHWDALSSAWQVFTIYPVRADPAAQLSARYFERIRLLTNDGQTLRGFEADRMPGEGEAPEGLRLVGSYPIRGAADATELVSKGHFRCPETLDSTQLLLQNESLVYLPDCGHELLMPFYCFWASAGQSGAGSEPVSLNNEYLPLYVPAVGDFWLRDWQIEREDAYRLQALRVGRVGEGEAPLLLSDPEAFLASGPLQADQRVNTLPVYTTLPVTPGYQEYLTPSEQTMAQLAELFATRFGIEHWDGLQFDAPENDRDLHRIVTVEAETELGLLHAEADGSVTLLFNAAQRYTPDPEAGYAEAEADPALIRLFAAQVIKQGGLNRELPWDIVSGFCPLPQTFPGMEQPLYAAELYPSKGGVPAYSLSRIKLWYRDGTLWGFTLSATLLSDPRLFIVRYGDGGSDSAAQDPLLAEQPWTPLELGNYPVITPAEARTLARDGRFAGVGNAIPADWELLDLPTAYSDMEEIPMDLIYLPNGSGEQLLPFYRFLFRIGQEARTGAAVFEPRYVPAVNALFLEDWPPSELPAEPDETAPEETAPASTEPPDDYQPMPAGLDPDGTPLIAGPAGNVEALHYMGPELHDPVWADLDGDGQSELIYWCNGPTSGLFTAGVCVYGLEEGWPVLEAAQFYNLTWGGLRLTEEDGKVLLHYTPQRYDPEAGSTVFLDEQVLSVSVQDGELLLNGGVLPEGCEPWGGPEWTWFGRSMRFLKTKALEAAAMSDMPRLPVYGRSCAVWLPPSASSVPTAGQRVFAAVSENGVSVTGLLRWEPRQDGSYSCAMQGVEAIEVPEPAALPGLSVAALTERFGPRHFETDDPTPKLCWFTEDCRLLTVSLRDGLVTDATLTALSPQSD